VSFSDAKNAFPGLEVISIRDYSALVLAYFEMEQNGGQMQKNTKLQMKYIVKLHDSVRA
jgi:hypothetical protein